MLAVLYQRRVADGEPVRSDGMILPVGAGRPVL